MRQAPFHGASRIIGFSQWSRLYDVHGQELAHDGKSAASVLLAYQTPGVVIPPLAQEELEAFALELVGEQGYAATTVPETTDTR